MRTIQTSLPPADGVSETALARRAALRDAEAIRTIMRRYNRRLYRMARSILGNDSEAEDALQNAYLKAFRALDEFRGEAGLGTWLTRIVINEALALVRSRKPQVELSDRDDLPAGATIIPFPAAANIDPEQAMAQSEIQRAVESAIDQLPTDFRTVLIARVLEGMSVEETAELLDIRVETVKTRLHRARRLLRLAVEEQIGPVLLDAFPFAGRRCDRMTETVLARLGLVAI